MLVIFACIQSLRTEMLVARAWGWFEPVSEKAVLSTTSAGQEHRATPWCLSISWSVSQWQCCLSIRKQTIHCCAIKRWAHWHTYLWVWTFICHLSLLVGVLCACMNQTAGVTLVTTRPTPHPKHTDTHSHMWTHTRSTLIRQPDLSTSFYPTSDEISLSPSFCRQGLCCIPDEVSVLSLRAFCSVCVCVYEWTHAHSIAQH